MKKARRAALGSGVFGLAAIVAGCDIVQGFQDAGDALFPEERTYLNAPGLRLVAGNYRDLSFANGDELYLLARKPDDERRDLVAMLYSAPRPCVIPQVRNYMTNHIARLAPAAVAYFEEDVWQGKLRFADTSCRIYPSVLDNARPVDGTPTGFVVWKSDAAGVNSVSMFNPVTGAEEELATNLSGLAVRYFAGHHVAFKDGHFVVFAPDWAKLGEFGSNVTRAERAGSSVFYQDDSGVRRMKPMNGGVTDTLVDAEACELSSRDEPWVHYYSPCGEQRLVVYYEPESLAAPLDIEAQPRHLELRPAFGSPGTDPATQRFWFFYLRDVDPATDLGTLVMRAPDGSERELGTGATLDMLELVDDERGQYGYALVDVVDGAGTYRYWDMDDASRDLASNTLQGSDRLLVDFDGEVGRLAAASRDTLQVIAEGVPYRGYEYHDRKSRWSALFHDFDGEQGRLSLLDGSLDATKRSFELRGTASFELETIAPRVGYYRTAFLDFVLPGVIYIANHDLENDVGLLEYRNLELGFTAQISEGVADFIVTADDVLYTVPYGSAAGIWLLQAK